MTRHAASFFISHVAAVFVNRLGNRLLAHRIEQFNPPETLDKSMSAHKVHIEAFTSLSNLRLLTTENKVGHARIKTHRIHGVSTANYIFV